LDLKEVWDIPDPHPHPVHGDPTASLERAEPGLAGEASDDLPRVLGELAGSNQHDGSIRDRNDEVHDLQSACCSEKNWSDDDGAPGVWRRTEPDRPTRTRCGEEGVVDTLVRLQEGMKPPRHPRPPAVVVQDTIVTRGRHGIAEERVLSTPRRPRGGAVRASRGGW
jgi:hypothetical protein